MSAQLWTILVVVSLATMLGILHVMASWIGSETQLHELRRRVAELRAQRLERMKEIAESRVKIVKTDSDKSGGEHHSKAA
jgi:ribosomal protein S13